MKRLLLALLFLCGTAFAQTDALQGFCDTGASQAAVSGLLSTNYQQGDIPLCQVSVYLTSTQTLATIYADGNNTPLSNPFTATTKGHWIFWAMDGQGYDVVGNGGIPPNNYPAPITLCTDCKVGSSSGSSISFTSNGLPPVFTDTITGSPGNAIVQTFALSTSTGNTIFGNWSNGLHAPIYNTVLAGGSCVSPNALGWTAGTGITCGAVTGQVSAENLEYIFTTPCNFPTPCSDIVFTPVPYAPSQFLGGPPQLTDNLGYGTNSVVTQDQSGTESTATFTFPNLYIINDPLVVQVTNDCSGCTVHIPTDTCGNTFTQVYLVGNQGIWYVQHAKACLTADVVSIPLGGNGGWMAGGIEVVNGGTLDTSVSGGSGTCTGTGPNTITFPNFTATVPDIVIVAMNMQGIAGGPFGTYNAGTNYTMEAQDSVYGGGGLGASRAVGFEWGIAPAAGTNNATAQFTLGTGGSDCPASISSTLAFRPSVSALPGNPTPRIPRYTDLQQSGDFPALAGHAGQFLTVNATSDGLTVGAGGISSIQFENSGTNFGTPMVGVGSLNCSGCTFSGTSPNFTLTTAGSGSASFPINSQTADYQVLAADFTACKVISVPSASGGITVTLVDTSTQPANGQCIWVNNYSTNGVVTIARSGQDINGGTSSLLVEPSWGAFIVSDGTNYIASQFPSLDIGGKNNNAVFSNGAYPVGQNNTVVGFSASGGSDNNTIVGSSANGGNSSSSHNVTLGYQAASGTFNYSNTVAIGYFAAAGGALNNSTIIGYQVGSNNSTGAGSVLIGTSSTVDGNASATTNYLNIGNLIAGDMGEGILILRGPTTTVASNDCGSTSQGTLTSGSNDMVGEVVVGTATVTSCAVSFASTHSVAPFCQCTSESTTVAAAGLACSASTTKVTAASAGNLDSTKWTYHCIAGSTSNNPIP